MSELFYNPTTATVLLLAAFFAACCAFMADEAQPETHKARNWAIASGLLWYTAFVAQVTLTLIASAVVIFCLFIMVPVLLHRVRHPKSKELATDPIFIGEDGRMKW